MFDGWCWLSPMLSLHPQGSYSTCLYMVDSEQQESKSEIARSLDELVQLQPHSTGQTYHLVISDSRGPEIDSS